MRFIPLCRVTSGGQILKSSLKVECNWVSITRTCFRDEFYSSVEYNLYETSMATQETFNDQQTKSRRAKTTTHLI